MGRGLGCRRGIEDDEVVRLRSILNAPAPWPFISLEDIHLLKALGGRTAEVLEHLTEIVAVLDKHPPDQGPVFGDPAGAVNERRSQGLVTEAVPFVRWGAIPGGGKENWNHAGNASGTATSASP